MKTKTEFVELMKAKGMSGDWALEELKRRRSRPDIWARDEDPDCQLPRVQMHWETVQAENKIRARDKIVTAEISQIRNPTAEKG